MDDQQEIIIETSAGSIKGRQLAGHQDFLGIYYAMPPVGELRFKPPQRLDRWDGIYDGTHYAPMAPQAFPDTPPIQLPESENCLSLNIFTPSADRKARPVMVYIHGGGYLIDSGSRPRTYGGSLAEMGNVVVVTIEYRMGAFGFLYTEDISPNLGLQDQVCALEWVRHHIADFGGDPYNVTIFGESAGATSVAYLLVMPSARGLFQKAILESGAFPFESQAQNQHFARSGTRKFFKALNIDPRNLASLQAASYEAVLQAEKKTAGQLLFSDRAFYPVIDGEIIPLDVYGKLRNGCFQGVPVIIGVNAEELPIFGIFVKNGLLQALIRTNIIAKLRKLGATSRQIRKLSHLYRQALPVENKKPNREYNQLFSDENFRIPAILFAEAHMAAGNKVFFYCFNHPAPKIGVASHVLELYFVFGSLGTTDIAEMMQVPCTEAEVKLSESMMKAWASFAHAGDPNYPGLPGWVPYDLTRRATMFLEPNARLVDLHAETTRSAWMEIARTSILKK